MHRRGKGGWCGMRRITRGVRCIMRRGAEPPPTTGLCDSRAQTRDAEQEHHAPTGGPPPGQSVMPFSSVRPLHPHPHRPTHLQELSAQVLHGSAARKFAALVVAQ